MDLFSLGHEIPHPIKRGGPVNQGNVSWPCKINRISFKSGNCEEHGEEVVCLRGTNNLLRIFQFSSGSSSLSRWEAWLKFPTGSWFYKSNNLLAWNFIRRPFPKLKRLKSLLQGRTKIVQLRGSVWEFWSRIFWFRFLGAWHRWHVPKGTLRGVVDLAAPKGGPYGMLCDASRSTAPSQRDPQRTGTMCSAKAGTAQWAGI